MALSRTLLWALSPKTLLPRRWPCLELYYQRIINSLPQTFLGEEAEEENYDAERNDTETQEAETPDNIRNTSRDMNKRKK